MEFILNKSNLEKISWNNEILTIYYNSGQVVKYENVPEGIAVGMAQAPSAGSYMNRYICGKYSYVITKRADIVEENKKLQHHKDTTVGLWATDRPDMIPDELKEKYFFKIEYSELSA